MSDYRGHDTPLNEQLQKERFFQVLSVFTTTKLRQKCSSSHKLVILVLLTDVIVFGLGALFLLFFLLLP